MRRLPLVFACASCFLVPFVSCKKDDEESKKKKGGQVQLSFVSSRLAVAAELWDTFLPQWATNDSFLVGDPNATVGQNTAAELETLAYRLDYIRICNSLTLNGSGYSDSSGCWDLTHGKDRPNYDTYLPDDALADTTHFANLVDTTAVQALAADVTYSSKEVREYNWVSVGWFRPFKVKATVTLPNGTKLYTKASTNFQSNGQSGLNVTYKTMVTDMATGPAEEAVFFLSNGGSIFKLQTPFAITSDDVKQKRNFQMVMAFEPEALIKASLEGDTQDAGMHDSATGASIRAPFIDLAPVVAREGETIMRETYLLSSVGDSNFHYGRLSLYYVKEDTDKSVRAATITRYNSPWSTSAVSDFGKITTVQKNSDNTLDLLDWQSVAVLDNFERLAAEGDTGTVTALSCNNAGGEKSTTCTATTSATYNYILRSVAAVDAAVTLPAEMPTPSSFK